MKRASKEKNKEIFLTARKQLKKTISSQYLSIITLNEMD